MSTTTAGRRGDDGALGSVMGAAAAALAVLLAPFALAGRAPLVERGPPAAPLVAATAGRYLDAWQRGDLAAMRQLVAAPPPDFDAAHARFAEALQVAEARFEPGAAVVAGSSATVPFTASLDLAGLGTWNYDGRLELVFAEPEPLAVDAEPVAEVARPVEAAAAGPRPPLPVGGRAPHWAVSWSPTTLHPALLSGAALARQRSVAPRAPLVGVGGVALTGPGAPRLPALSAQVLGSLGTLDDAGAAALGLLYQRGDVVGTSGLQAAANAQLFGRPSGAVHLVDEAGKVLQVLHVFAGEAPVALATTLDVEVQAAAEAALSAASKPAALVAVDAPTGQIRAVANRPVAGFNRALAGRYPPGSTFKVVTTAALLASGVTPETPVSCPASASVAGFPFSNAGGEALGDIPFATAFFRSCNTAFVQLADDLDAATLVATAESFGFNAEVGLPVAASGGSFPVPQSPVEKAAAAIGQAQVTASPLQMSTVAAAVASGTWHPPQLLLEPEPPTGQPLPEGVAATLRELMVRVVEEGTGTAARLPGEAVGGKTGTAEFGSTRPPRTHAWFIGFRGDLACAVVVEDGGFGGEVAAPIARSFLSRLG